MNFINCVQWRNSRGGRGSGCPPWEVWPGKKTLKIMQNQPFFACWQGNFHRQQGKSASKPPPTGKICLKTGKLLPLTRHPCYAPEWGPVLKSKFVHYKTRQYLKSRKWNLVQSITVWSNIIIISQSVNTTHHIFLTTYINVIASPQNHLQPGKSASKRENCPLWQVTPVTPLGRTWLLGSK